MSFLRAVLEGIAKKLPVFRPMRRDDWIILGAQCLAFGVPYGLMEYYQPVHRYGLRYYSGEEVEEYAESVGLLPPRKKQKKSPQEEGMETAS